jgi:hypothetical protein
MYSKDGREEQNRNPGLDEMRPKQLFAINEFYPLVDLCLMGMILGAWKKKAA